MIAAFVGAHLWKTHRVFHIEGTIATAGSSESVRIMYDEADAHGLEEWRLMPHCSLWPKSALTTCFGGAMTLKRVFGSGNCESSR